MEDGRITVEALSGTSAGAVNAAAFVAGYAKNGPQGAREALDAFWLTISEYAAFSPIQRTWADQVFNGWSLDRSLGYMWSNWVSQLVSPYQTNPLNIQPLRDVLNRLIDFDALRSCQDIRLFISATNVRTGRARIFSRNDISVDALMASACLPHISQAVEIDSEAYWDGGYMGNPSIWPLIYNAKTADVVLVQITPLERDNVPRTSYEISSRLDEIAFNSSLIHEMRAIAFVKRLLDDGALKEPYASHYKNVRMHMIGNEAELSELGTTSKLNVEHNFLAHLKELGRNCASQWLAQNYDDLGKQSSIDIRSTFL